MRTCWWLRCWRRAAASWEPLAADGNLQVYCTVPERLPEGARYDARTGVLSLPFDGEAGGQLFLLGARGVFDR